MLSPAICHAGVSPIGLSIALPILLGARGKWEEIHSRRLTSFLSLSLEWKLEGTQEWTTQHPFAAAFVRTLFFFFSNLHKASLKSTFVVSELCKVFSRWKFSLEFSTRLRTFRHVLTELLTWAKSEITNNLSGLNPIGTAIHTVASFFESNIPRAKWIFVGTETWL